MDDTVQKSCWGLAAKAAVAVACIIFIAWLFGATDTATVLASR